MDETKKMRVQGASRTRSIAFVGLTVAIMAVSAWVTVPLGPVPFTLQMFALTFAILVLSPKEAMAAVACYLVLGALGAPVFSGMRGGVGVLAGPTGGFLWGYLLGVAAAVLLLWTLRGRRSPRAAGSGAGRRAAQAAAQGGGLAGVLRGLGLDAAAGLLFTAVSYVCGWAQFMAVAGVGPVAAFATAIAPFIVVDVLKVVAAALVARAVRRAVR